jgi:hypothetical protein
MRKDLVCIMMHALKREYLVISIIYHQEMFLFLAIYNHSKRAYLLE